MNCSPSGEPLENYDDEIIGHEFRILGTNEHESGNHCLEQHDKVIEGQRQLVFGENCSTRSRIFCQPQRWCLTCGSNGRPRGARAPLNRAVGLHNESDTHQSGSVRLSKLHPVGEGWVFRGYDVFPYDAGHTLFVGFTSGEEGVIRLQCHTDSQAHILEFLERYVTRAEQANAGDA